MPKTNFRCANVLIVLLVLSACSSSPKKEAVIIAPVSKVLAPKLMPQDQDKYALALTMMKSKAFDQAAVYFEELLKQYPDLVGAMVNLALIDQAGGNLDRALERYAHGLSINENNLSALIQSSVILQQKGKFSEAEANLRRAHAIDNVSPIVNYNLGVLYELYLQEFGLAIQHYKRYVAVSKQDDVETVKRWIKLLEMK